MKRTRHIEITRYRRYVTVSQGADDIANPAAGLLAIEVAAGEWEVIPSGDEHADDGSLKMIEPAVLQISPQQISKRRPRFSLREWLRLRRRNPNTARTIKN